MTKVRVLVAEDSDAMRSTLETLFRADPRLDVIGTARDGVEAVELVKTLRPDLVTMDVMMPRLDGVGATARIMAEAPVRILMISAHADDRQIDLSFRAMAAGALEVVAKPKATAPHELRAWAQRVCDTIVLMAEVPVITRARRVSVAGRRIDIVGIVASTGGPLALAQLLGALPRDLPIPVLVAQHIAEGFTEGLIRWLAGVSKIGVEIARDGTSLRPGRAYFPPDGRDLEVGADGLLRAPAVSGRYAPSGDVLLASIARYHRSRGAGIVMTGMGEDGATGLLALRDAGGATFVQSPETCVVNGMPNAALVRGATSDARAPEALANAIAELASRRAVTPTTPP
jgi:two-component system chemotaxis response regulator CheB